MVDLDEEVSVDDLRFSLYQNSQINKRIADLKERLYWGDDIENPHKISPEDIQEDGMVALPNVTISDCQIVIELSAKSIFKSVGVNPVTSHDIDFNNERVSGVLTRVQNIDDFSERVPRVIFLTQFWERFYTLSKYGVPEQNISSFEIMNKSDALRALQDADFCKEVANDVHSHVLHEKGLEESDLDADMFRHI